jgi:hypothetical protein
MMLTLGLYEFAVADGVHFFLLSSTTYANRSGGSHTP